MNRKIRQFILRVAAVVMLAAAIPFQSFAANGKIAFSDPTAQVGSEFNVTMKFTSTSGDVLGNTKVYLTYDDSAIEFLPDTSSSNASGGEGTIIVTSGMEGKTEISTQLAFKALKAGSTKIEVVTDNSEAYDEDGQILTMDRIGSSAVTISAAASGTFSTDASLKSLQISPGTLEPAFQADVESYTATVGLDTDQLTVSAVPSSDKASVAVTGDTQLQEGENKVTCTVTAEDGTTVRSYTITVTKEEGGQNPSDVTETETQPQLEVLAELESARTLTKIGVTDLPDDVDAPAGLKESSITIGDTKVTGWTPAGEGTPEYCVFYGVGDNGEQGFYRYDMTDKTIQRYFQDASADIESSPEYQAEVSRYKELRKDYVLMRALAIGAGVVAVVLLIAVVAVTKRSGQGRAGGGQGNGGSEPDEEMRTPRGKRLSREERYMMGEEEEYDDSPEEDSSRDYLPEESRTETPEEKRKADHEEKALEAKLASDMAAASKEEDDEDFETFDLDDDEK